MIKKILLTFALLTTFSLQAVLVTSTNNLASAGVAILPTMIGGPAQIRYVLLTSDASNAASCLLYDTQFTGTKQTNAAYISVSRYATNYVWSTYTNYYGATNYLTNTVLVSLLVTNSATTNSLPVQFSLIAPTNGMTEFQNLNTTFARGIMVTNTGVGTLSISVGYLQ